MATAKNHNAPEVVARREKGKAIIAERGADIFKSLEFKSYREVAQDFGLVDAYQNAGTATSAVVQFYNKVVDDPQKYGVEVHTAKVVKDVVQSRSPHKKEVEVTNESIGDILIGTRNLAAKLLRKKLQMYEEDPKLLQNEKLVQLTTALAILFDKGQIIQGAATEHIAVMSNIPDHLDPDEALKTIMAMREKTLESKG